MCKDGQEWVGTVAERIIEGIFFVLVNFPCWGTHSETPGRAASNIELT